MYTSDRRSRLSACPLYTGYCWSLLDRGRRRGAAPAQSSGDSADERVAALRRLLSDYGGLTRYGSENAELPPPRAGEHRVVFFGDDATERWKDAAFFAGKPYLNRGIGGQNSAQLLLRFRQDVIGLAPAVVVIHAGTNDLARMLGPGTRGTFADNIMSMTELAKANGIRVVLASILPGVRLLQRSDVAALAGAPVRFQRMAARLCQIGRRWCISITFRRWPTAAASSVS